MATLYSNPPRQKPYSESKRQEDVFRYYNPSLGGVDLRKHFEAHPNSPLPPPDHVPRPSLDVALTAFAQLGAIRLNAARALISLLDGSSHYILAEGTPTSALRHGRQNPSKDDLWLGNSILPSSESICRSVLTLDDVIPTASDSPALPAVVINDLLKDERHSSKSFVRQGPRARFYAGVPLISPAGYTIGSFCVLDGAPRHGLSRDQLLDMHDMAAVVMDHLVSLKFGDEHRRGEQMLRGLTSFVEGAKSLQAPTSPVEEYPSPKRRRQATDDEDDNERRTSRPPPMLHTEESTQSQASLSSLPEAQDGSKGVPKTAQERILPSGSKKMFSRAANIIKDTSDLDGVIIFDAVIAAIPEGRRFREASDMPLLDQQPKPDSLYDSTSSSGGESLHSTSSSLGRNRSPTAQQRKTCEVLGYATDEGSSLISGRGHVPPSFSLPESILRKMLRRYPSGKVLSFNRSGDSSSTEESDLPDAVATLQRNQRSAVTDAIRKVAPGARSVVFIPLWDYERSRWFAGCLFWTTKPYRSLSSTTDLPYFKAFGNSVMTELARLDAIASSKAKSAFASMISHELRSPLHGIMGGVQFLQETKLDAFQGNMLGAIDTCGRTLLDTIDHLLDYAKISQYSKATSSAGTQGSPWSLGELKTLTTTLDVSVCAEDVVEAVFAGQSYGTLPMRIDESDAGAPVLARRNSQDKTSGAPDAAESNRKPVTILFDVQPRDNWKYRTQAGALRRVLINVFGNSLKYTSTGYIYVYIRAEETRTKHGYHQAFLRVDIRDTGIGMSEDYLLNKLYRPFSQENPFYAGTGLGLSIVRQLIDSLGGTIDFRSEAGVGTDVKISIPVVEAEPRAEPDPTEDDCIFELISKLKGKMVCILEKQDRPPKELRPRNESHSEVTCGLLIQQTMQSWFEADTFITDKWTPASADLIICTEPSFDLLSDVRNGTKPGEKAPIVVFVALDAIEASVLRDDARILSKRSVVEVITQPCGPHKLSKSLLLGLNKFEMPSENVFDSPEKGEELFNSCWDAVLMNVPETPPEVSGIEPSMQAHPPPHNDPQAPIGAPRVLIVDDNQINRRLLVAFLKKKRLGYAEAVNGLEAVQMYRDSNPKYQLILMDVSMPVMDGMTATRKIRRYEQQMSLQRTKIIALTGLASSSANVEARESGMDLLLTKPVQFKALGPYLPNIPSAYIAQS